MSGLAAPPFHRPVTTVKGQTDKVPSWPQLPKGPPPPPGPMGRWEVLKSAGFLSPSGSLLDNQVCAGGVSRLPRSPVLRWRSPTPAWLAKLLKHPCQHCRPVFANYTTYKHKCNHCLLLAKEKHLHSSQHQQGHKRNTNSANTGCSIPSHCKFAKGEVVLITTTTTTTKRGGKKRKSSPLPAKNYAAAGPQSVCQMTRLSHS